MKNDTNIGFLLKYCSEYPELYNSIANELWVQFDIKSAEIALLVTYFVAEDRNSGNHFVEAISNEGKIKIDTRG